MCDFRMQAGRVKHTQQALFRAPAIPRNSFSFVEHLKLDSSDKRYTIQNHRRERYEVLLNKSEIVSQ